MQVQYTAKGERFAFELEQTDDLREIIPTIERHLRDAHPALAGHPRLPLLVSEGVLNSLAEERGTIDLGDLAG